MSYNLRNSKKLRKAEIISTRDLKGKDYLMFDFVWDENVEQTRDTKSLLAETFSILPPYPIIFPVPTGAPKMLLRKLKGLDLLWLPNLGFKEVKYLEHHAMGIVHAVPLKTEDGLVLHINLSSKPRSRKN